jgi:hypothetical protein
MQKFLEGLLYIGLSKDFQNIYIRFSKDLYRNSSRGSFKSYRNLLQKLFDSNRIIGNNPIGIMYCKFDRKIV